MRILITLHCRPGSRIPLNYQYEVSSWIYRTLAQANPEFADWLHEHGYALSGNKAFKLFTFSHFDLEPPFRIEPAQGAIWLGAGCVRLTLSFLLNQPLEHFVAGIFQQQQFSLGNSRVGPADFTVQSIDILPPPSFSSPMRFRALSPICIAANEPEKHAQYRHPADPDYAALLQENLSNKLAIAHHYDFTLPSNMAAAPLFQFRLLNEPRQKGITLKAFTSAQTKVIGYMFDFEIQAEPALLEVGYYAGFGVENAQGFGCVGVE